MVALNSRGGELNRRSNRRSNTSRSNPSTTGFHRTNSNTSTKNTTTTSRNPNTLSRREPEANIHTQIPIIGNDEKIAQGDDPALNENQYQLENDDNIEQGVLLNTLPPLSR